MHRWFKQGDTPEDTQRERFRQHRLFRLFQRELPFRLTARKTSVREVPIYDYPILRKYIDPYPKPKKYLEFSGWKTRYDRTLGNPRPNRKKRRKTVSA